MSEKKVLDDLKKNKKRDMTIKKIKKKNNPEWFGPWTIDPISFLKDVVIIQRRLIFSTTKNIARSQMAALNTSHWLSRCQVVLNKRLLLEMVLLIRIWVFEFCHDLSCWVLSHFELFIFFSQNFSFWHWSNFELNFVLNEVFEFCFSSSY